MISRSDKYWYYLEEIESLEACGITSNQYGILTRLQERITKAMFHNELSYDEAVALHERISATSGCKVPSELKGDTPQRAMLKLVTSKQSAQVLNYLADQVLAYGVKHRMIPEEKAYADPYGYMARCLSVFLENYYSACKPDQEGEDDFGPDGDSSKVLNVVNFR